MMARPPGHGSPGSRGARARPATRTRRRATALAAAVLLAVGLALAPGGTRDAAAATGQLLISAAADYAVDLDAAVVHVAVAATFVNDKPSDASLFYYWRDLSWAVHSEAENIQVRDPGGPLRVTPVAEDGFIDAQFRLRRDLLYGQSIDLAITWDLPGGAPRSASTVRVGQAFAAFDLWAWGDGGTSSVTATLPLGFVAETIGSAVRTTSGPGGVTITAAPIADPDNFWTTVAAVRERSLAEEELTLPGDIELLVKGWPEDRVWRTTVASMLRRGLPRLQELVGLPWPVDDRLEVTEVYAPLLEGFAGLFFTDEQRIEISEELDDVTILHEGAHAWFNGGLFVDRWIGEGLAEAYATAVLRELTGARHDPDRPRANDDGEVDLVAWAFPGRITEESAAREAYGYNASWYVVDELFDEIGAERMQAVLAAAAGDTIAYVGSPSPETVGATDTWRRFLDLLVEVGGSGLAEQLFRDYVTTPTDDRTLDTRADAREAYAALVDAGDGWLPPLYVREALGAWAFDAAEARIDEAAAVLDLRDEVDLAAGELELQPDDALERAYETATDDLERAEALAEAHVAALEALARANAAIDAEADLLTTIGLLGSTPDAEYGAGAAAFEAGDLDEATEAAAAVTEIVAAAPRLGGERLATGIGIVLAAAVLLGVVLVLRRRERRRAQALAAIGTAGGAPVAGPVAFTPTTLAAAPFDPATPPSVGGPYGTLAADPPADPSRADVGSGPEGGSGDGDGSDTGR